MYECDARREHAPTVSAEIRAPGRARSLGFAARAGNAGMVHLLRTTGSVALARQADEEEDPVAEAGAMDASPEDELPE